ncbi:MAG: pantetheine-phosphate adenylyltransferase [Candidatus Thalassarchaeaceae archaeon]|jgi:cytidyltransferase-like protein|nr:pantetheine-phosphate adenylyltransferase [Candidatus Thalassarchaeaceae archaeon]
MSGSLCLVGGTFDRLHLGHQTLLESVSNFDNAEVWITADSIAQQKDPRIQPYDERVQSILNWKPDYNFAIHCLEDQYGPAPTHQEATHIVCTSETKLNCFEINKKRLNNGLEELILVEVDHTLAKDGLPISSSRIRQGSIDRNGELWIQSSDLQDSVHMVKLLDSELKKPQGHLFKGPEDNPRVAIMEAINAIPTFCPCLIAVGDVTVNSLLEAGWVPDIALIDGMTKREVWAQSEKIDRSSFVGQLTCSNPPGQLTPDLLECADLCFEFAFSEDGGPVLLEIDGEEDLAPIFLHLLAPLGTAILYGQPGEGVVLRITDEEVKSNCRYLLNHFEVR